MENESQELSLLPEYSPEDLKVVLREAKEKNKELIVHQNFTKRLNLSPNMEQVKEHPLVKGVKYLPIGIMQMMMDELFFGLWSTDNFRWQQIGNEIVGALDISFFHPTAKVWIKRSGAAAIQIMCDAYPFPDPQSKDPIVKAEYISDRNKWYLNSDNKKPNALSRGGFSALDAFCFKNAVITIGQRFGRDINREFWDKFEPWVESISGKITGLRLKIEEALAIYEADDREEIIDSIVKAEKEGINSISFYEGIMKRMGIEQQ